MLSLLNSATIMLVELILQYSIPTLISNEIKEKDDKANEYERLRLQLWLHGPLVAGSQALFKEATYDRTDSDDEYNRHNQLRWYYIEEASSF